MVQIARNSGISESCLQRWLKIADREDGLARRRPAIGLAGARTSSRTAGAVESPPKASSQRVVHLPPQGVSALAEQRTRSPALPTARLFVRRDGRALPAHHVHAAWSSARRAADLPGAHLHDLRHAGLTLAARSGATLAEVMRRAGHSSSCAATIYQHATERRDAEVAARLGHLAAGTTPNRTGT